MQRAHALRLIITNWKGILFHCFEIDRHLTGLQGPNGAGKTTVMAAYLTAIIPNLRLLSFKNVTSDEAGKAGDATLWGRLGEGPCYTLLEWQTPKGTRLWAGVLLTRGNMPHIDLKLFTLEGLPEMVDPYDAFLVRDSSLIRIPTYPQLKDHLALLGGKVTTHSTLQNYMRALYEAGITPMPMMNYEEQERFYRILASSMSGSSLATLTRSGLRNYLFTEDQSLERRVTNLRECLGQCRHTRHELDQASSAHAEISGLFDAAWKMSSYAYYGALSKYGQTQQKWNDQKVLVREERATAESLQADLKCIVQEEVDLKVAYQAADKAVTKAIEERDKTKTAWELRIEIENRAERLIDLEAESLQTKTALDKAQADETAATTADRVASAETSRISRELGDLNKAVEALVKRAMLFEAAQKCLAAAQAALNNSKLRPDEAKAYIEEYDARYDYLTEKLTRTEADLDAFDDQQKNFDRLLAELNRILADDGHEGAEPQEAYPEALRLDSWLREMQALAATAETLSTSLIRTKQLASQQATIQEAARTLGITSRAALEDEIALINATRERLEAEKQVKSDALAETNQQIADIKEALPDLEEAARQFRRGSELRTQLGDGGVALEETQVRTEFEALWHTWQQAAEEVHEFRVQLESSIRRIRERIDALRSQSGMLDQRIGALAEHLDGTLFASYFDELSAEDAAITEARLGSWVEAIVVSAPALAAKQATEFPDRPDNLLFVAEEAVSHQREAQSVGDSEIIEEHLGDIEGVRVTRRPERPALGRRAREAEIARLEGELSADEARLRDLSETELLWKRRISLGNQLLALGKGAWAPDPEPTLTSEKSRLTGLEVARNSLKNTLANFERQLAEVATRKKKYQSLEPQKDLIDPPNYAEEVRRLSAQLEAAQAAQDWVRRFHAPVQTILKDLPILRKVPDPRERERLAAQVNEWSKQRAALNIKRDSLASLVTVLPHFAYAEEKRVHDEQSSIMESLQAQLDVAEGRRERTLKYLEVMREGLRKAHDAHGEAYRQHQVVVGEQAKAKNNFKTLGLQGTDEELEFAKATVQNTATARDAAYDRHQKASEQKGRLETALDTANKALAAAQSKSWDAFDTIRTERRALRELRKTVAAVGLTGKIDSEKNRERFDTIGNPIQAFAESRAEGGKLIERLKAYPTVTAEVEALIKTADLQEERRAILTLRIWERVHRHIEQRIPRNIATSDDPQVALAQMADKMGELRRTLDAQESQLRTQSVGITGAIGARIQSARRLITKLNHELKAVAFGSIRGVQIRFEENETMKRVLAALEETGMDSLFDTDIPLEDVLSGLYKKIAGGNILGAQILDYRNYLNLKIEVLRITGVWEPVSDSLSTGEAIGVGSAILIMILRTWNEEAKRISGKAAGFSMQQVLLDEATRLDQNALDTFTDFCQRMDVQSLIAAPDLERPRRSTIFILQRQEVNKREQVVIRGQRIIA